MEFRRSGDEIHEKKQQKHDIHSSLAVSCIKFHFLILSILFCKQSFDCNLLLSLGCGGLSSIIVAFFVDLSNTSINNKNDEKICNRLIKFLEIRCSKLPSEFLVNIQEYRKNEKHIYNVKYTFQKWVELLFEECHIPNDADIQKREIQCCIDSIHELLTTANEFLSLSKIYYANPCISEELEAKVEKMCSFCQKIIRAYNNNDLSTCKKFITSGLVQSITEIFPAQKELYNSRYNMDDFI